jgi:nicotinate-nucleotide adenylyltransferase
MITRIGILGGTFDPIHRGHMDLGNAAQAALHLTRIVVIPSSTPPHRAEPVASGFHRFAMVALTVAGQPAWQVSDLELKGEAPSFTSRTLLHFLEHGHRPSDLFFVTGTDAFAEIQSWKDYPEILDRANFVVVARPGGPIEDMQRQLPLLAPRMTRLPFSDHAMSHPAIILIDAQTAGVSSTAIRERCVRGESIAGLVAPSVEQHIERHGLYRSAAGHDRPGGTHVDASAGKVHGKS